MPALYERKRLLKLDSTVILRSNEIGEVTSLVSCHVCVIRISGAEKDYLLMSHYRVTDTAEHVAAIRSTLYNGVGLNLGVSPLAFVLLFRLSSVQLVKSHASLGTIYHVDKYEEATKALKTGLMDAFDNCIFREISYGYINNAGCWIKVNANTYKWESSFGHGLIEVPSPENRCPSSLAIRRHGGT